MADPFSILEVTQTAGAAAVKLAQIIRNLAEAPSELLALSNELLSLQIVLEDWREMRRNAPPRIADETSDKDAEGALFFQTRIKLDELNSLTSQWGKVSNFGDSWNMGRRDRFLWLKEKKRVSQLQIALRELRTNLIACTGIKTSASVTRLEVDVRNLAEQYVRLHDEAADTSRKSNSITELVQESSGTLQNIQRHQSESKDVLLEIMAAVERMSIDQRADQRFDEYIEQKPQSSQEKSSHLQNTPILGFDTPGSRDSPSEQSVFSMSIQAKLRNAHSCPPTCPCPCHPKTKVQSPQLLQQLLGRLFLGYNGTTSLRTICLPECSRGGSKTLNVTYFFPRWFFAKAVSLSVSEGLLGTPNLNLKIRRLVPEVSPIFAMSRYGDVEGLKQLFLQREASPDDVHVRGGWTPLHFAIDHGNVAACKLLLECGADPEWEDATGTTPIEIAWRNILHLRAPPRVSESFSTLFPGTEFMQERRFTRAHRIVIGVDASDLEKALHEEPQHVHAADVDGWEPVHWAARRGNHGALATLLARGADPLHVTENEQRNALHLAAQGNSLPCMQMLLQYRRGAAALDLETRDIYGNTALRIAASYNCAAATAKLIQLGADLDTRDNFGEPPLLSAVYENSHETITLLLRAGVDCSVRTKFGNSVLHFAANESDAVTLSILTRARMRNLDVAATNVEGSTARDLAEARDNAPPDFLALFDRLLASVEEDDARFEAQSVASFASSGNESWKSVEDSIWFDAHHGAHEDILEQEQAVESLEGTLLLNVTSAPRISARNFAVEMRSIDDMV